MNKDRSYIKCKQIKNAIVKSMHMVDLGSTVVVAAWTVVLTNLWVLISRLNTEVVFNTAAKRSMPCPLCVYVIKFQF